MLENLLKMCFVSCLILFIIEYNVQNKHGLMLCPGHACVLYVDVHT